MLTISSLTKNKRNKVSIDFPKNFQYLLERDNDGKHKCEFKGLQLSFDKKKQQFFASLNFTAEFPSELSEGNVLGIDRGIINTVSCSSGLEISGKNRNKIKRKYSYNKKNLQAKGTRSAKRKLRRLAGHEKRFSQNENHIISKILVNLPFKYLILEKLSNIRKQSKGKRFNRKLSNWSYYQLEIFIKYKAIGLGKVIAYVNPQYTSQRCNCCGDINRNNRKGSKFCCKKCGYTDGADLNASKNIRDLWISEKISQEQAPVNEPSYSLKKIDNDSHHCPTIKVWPGLNSRTIGRELTNCPADTSPFQASLGGVVDIVEMK